MRRNLGLKVRGEGSQTEGILMKMKNAFFAILLMISASAVFLACGGIINTIPVNHELLERYNFSEEALYKTAFHLSFQTVLKMSTTKSTYNRRGNTLDLYDHRQDDVYTVPVDCNGMYRYQIQESRRDFKLFFPSKEKTQTTLVIQFDPEGLPPIDLEFVENKDGFFALKKNDKGQIIVDNQAFDCLDGCNSLLLFNAGEHDDYRGIDHSFVDWTCLRRACIVLFIAFIALQLYSR